MSRHTPGPWLSSAVLPKRSNFEQSRRVRIGPLGDVLKTVGDSADEAKANGMLQAAAPELAEALEGLVQPCPTQDDYEQALEVARAALRKAGRLP